MRAFIASCALAAACSCGVAAEHQLESCDVPAAWTVLGGGATATTAASSVEGSGAVHLAVPIADWSWAPSAGFAIASGSTGSMWNSYEGIRFRVRGDGSTSYGVMSLIYHASYYRYYAAFPMTTSWTEVTIPWREFTQRHMRGRIEDHLADIHTLQFTHANNIDTGYPALVPVPAVSYDVDDIRLASGLTLEATPVPSRTSIDNVVAKLAAQLPVRIGWVGASVSYGAQCSDPKDQSAAAYQLQEMLKVAYGYDQVTVVNRSVGGSQSFSGFCNLDRYLAAEGPLDLIVFGEYFYNDYGDGSAPTIGAETDDNHRKIFASLLRRRGADVLYYLSGLHVETGYLTKMDPYASMLRSACADMHVTYADVYADFQARGDAYLLANFYTVDAVHYTDAGQIAAAVVVRDTILSVSPALAVTVPSSAVEGEGVLVAQGTVRLSLARHADLTVNVSSSDTGEITVATSVVIVAGSVEATFDLVVIDDGATDADQAVVITAAASGGGYADGTGSITVHDVGWTPPADEADGGGLFSCAPGAAGAGAHFAALAAFAVMAVRRRRGR